LRRERFERTFGREDLAHHVDLDGRLEAARILRAAAEEAPHDELVHGLLLAGEVVDVRRRVDRRVRLVVLLAVARTLEAVVVEEAARGREQASR